jgi:hypothetical protein
MEGLGNGLSMPLFVDRVHEAFADAKHVAVRVTQVHFANLPLACWSAEK